MERQVAEYTAARVAEYKDKASEVRASEGADPAAVTMGSSALAERTALKRPRAR